jgi:hypothetical protein
MMKNNNNLKKKDEKPANVAKPKEEKARSKSKTKEEPPKKAEKTIKTSDKKEKKEKVGKKKAKNPYFFYLEEMREKIKKENPKLQAKDILIEVGKLWKQLDDAGKKKYQDLSAKEKEKLAKENEAIDEDKGGKRKRSVGKNESIFIN